MANQIWLEFANGQYLAHLKNKRISEIERVRGRGFGGICSSVFHATTRISDDEMLLDMLDMQWFDADLIEILRQAFIGGGKATIDGETKAIEFNEINSLINNYVEDMPRMKLWELAAAICYATLEGYKPGEAEGAQAPSPEQAYSGQTDTQDT